MNEQYIKEQFIIEETELLKERDLIRNIIKTREDLKANNSNFEYAESGLIDYYVYEIKANHAKLDYLIKLAKSKGITIDSIEQHKFQNLEEEIS